MTNCEAIEILKIERNHMVPTLFTERIEAIDIAISALQAQDSKTRLCDTCKHNPPSKKWPCVDCDMREPADRWEPKDVPDTNVGDMISRQAAIDALHTWFRDGFDEDRWWNSTHVLAALEGLPSAQSDIIHCKDCKHWYSDADTGMACEFTNISQPEDGYCNWSERRTDERPD